MVRQGKFEGQNLDGYKPKKEPNGWKGGEATNRRLGVPGQIICPPEKSKP